MGKWKCPNCQNVNNSHAKYCIECGTYPSISEPLSKKVAWKCPACKAINNDSAKYCVKCGTWLLGTVYEAERMADNRNTLHRSPKNRTSNLKGYYIFESVVIALISLLLILGQSHISVILAAISIILFFSTLLLIVVLLVKQTLQMNLALKRFGVSVVFFVLAIVLSSGITEGYNSTAVLPPFDMYKTGALSLDYRDLARNAESTYLGKMVHYRGEIYHLENGKQKYLMVNVSDATKAMHNEVIFIEREDSAGNLLVGDIIDIYGLVKGTQKVKNILGAESFVPSIESHYIVVVTK